MVRASHWSSHTRHDLSVNSVGIIHEISQPLIPPPTVFEGLFLLGDMFSILVRAFDQLLSS